MESTSSINGSLPLPQTRTNAPATRPEPVVAVERTAWFDANGDGRIDTRSVVEGGDGYLIGDGNGDGHIAMQAVVYPPIAGRSRPAGSSEATMRRAEAAYRAETHEQPAGEAPGE